MKKLLILSLFSLMFVNELFAIHLRAANIEVERVAGSTTQYLVRLTVFSDDETDAYNGTSGGVEVANPQEIFLNDSPISIEVFAVGTGVAVGNKTNRTIFEKIVEVPSPNGKFLIKWNGVLRNAGIVNIKTVTALPYELFVETFFFLNGFDVPNNSPRMTIDPVDKGYVNTIFTYNSGAYDVDGDSISYELINIQAGSKNSSGALIGADIPSAVSPADPSIAGGGNLTIDPIRGTVTWDRPKLPGEYNIAIKINEWRNGIRIGYVIRDMQIIIDDTDFVPPLMLVPNDTCVVSGSLLNAQIIAWDENGADVKLEHYGLPKELGATLKVNKITADSLVADYNWLIDCRESRNQPYYSYFKAINNPTITSIALTAYEEWAITVISGPVENVKSVEVAEGVEVTWDEYCTDDGKAIGLELWRRSCDLSAVSLDYCTTGIPIEWGFQKVVDLDRGAISYVDSETFRGNKYYYVLIAKFSDQNGLYSVPSAVDSIQTSIDGPWITHASIVSPHDSLNGSVYVNWVLPSSFSIEAPYRVELLRSDSLRGGVYLPLDTLLLDEKVDSSFVDSGLDTYNGAYNYKIKFYYGVDEVYESKSVSIIDLDALADQRDVNLSWEVNAPVFTPDSLFNYIYRDYSSYDFLDSIHGESYAYIDPLLIGDSLYCYYIVKPSTYCNNSFDTLVYVTSNISCDTTFDIVAPCPPLLSIQPLDCETFDASLEVENILTWEWDLATCEEEQTEFYELFYKAKEEDEFVSLVKTVDTFYIQKSIDSYAGCYKIRAQDRSGNLGVFSDEVCNYNCESIVFPNVVTPNDDEKNDIFGPIPSPQFVEKIQFSVSNRWGKLVFQSDKGIEILWDLKNDDGEKVSDGVYYYEAVVTFDKYKEEDREKTFKGWIFVVR